MKGPYTFKEGVASETSVIGKMFAIPVWEIYFEEDLAFAYKGASREQVESTVGIANGAYFLGRQRGLLEGGL